MYFLKANNPVYYLAVFLYLKLVYSGPNTDVFGPYSDVFWPNLTPIYCRWWPWGPGAPCCWWSWAAAGASGLVQGPRTGASDSPLPLQGQWSPGLHLSVLLTHLPPSTPSGQEVPGDPGATRGGLPAGHQGSLPQVGHENTTPCCHVAKA